MSACVATMSTSAALMSACAAGARKRCLMSASAAGGHRAGPDGPAHTHSNLPQWTLCLFQVSNISLLWQARAALADPSGVSSYVQRLRPLCQCPAGAAGKRRLRGADQPQAAAEVCWGVGAAGFGQRRIPWGAGQRAGGAEDLEAQLTACLPTLQVGRQDFEGAWCFREMLQLAAQRRWSCTAQTPPMCANVLKQTISTQRLHFYKAVACSTLAHM